MGKTREIKKRIKAVANIKRITRTMQMIATARFAAAQQRALATKPYTEGVFQLVTELAATAGNITHPLINRPEGGFAAHAGELTLIITSDRGLCGPYNGSILRTALAHLRAADNALPDDGGHLELVGKKGLGYFRFSGLPVAAHHGHFGEKPTFEEVERLAQSYMDRFIAGDVTAVRVIYMRFISTGKQAPEVLQLLPLKPPTDDGAAKGPEVIYEFSPAADQLLGDLLPATVKATLFQCFNDAIVSEHVARMIAMKSATDNAGKMGKLLSRSYNRARQSQITTELTEIVSGAAALE